MKSGRKILIILITLFGILASEPKEQDFFNSKISLTFPELLDDESYFFKAELIALPNNAKPAIKVTVLDSSSYWADAFPNLTERLKVDAESSIARIGEIGQMRDLLVAPLIIKPVRYDKMAKSLIFYRKLEFVIDGLTMQRPKRVSPAFDHIYRNTVLNYQSPGLITPQGYLIIVPDEFYNNILPFARWKEEKGWYVAVKRLSEVGGNNPNAIRDYIANAYASWQIPPEYVLLVGSINKIEAFPSSGTPTKTDYPYACVAGSDNLADLMVGRFPASNTSELDVMVAKTIGYEKTPYLADTLWYRKALLVATTYQEGGGRVVTALATKRWVREKLLNNGFLAADTVFYDPPGQNPNAPETIRVLVNAGVSFINGRGWGNPEGWHSPQFYRVDVSGLENGWKLPVVTSIYCGTGNIIANPCFGEVWLRAGTPTNPRGGVAFFGAAWSATSTRFNNCIDYGIYTGIFSEGITLCGPAMYRGKLELMKNFPHPTDSISLRCHIETYNLLGDPSLAMWTGVPKPISVEHPTFIPIGGNYFTVRVTDYNGEPLSNALVSLFKTDEVKNTGYTDLRGQITLPIRPTTADTMIVTVTKHNRIPYSGRVLVIPSGCYVGYYNHTTNNLIPGTQASLNITLKNYGTTQTAYNTQARLRTQDHFIYLTDSVKNYGDINPGAIASASPFQFFIAESCPNNHSVNFELVIQSGDSVWYSGVTLTIPAPNLIVRHYQIIDGGNGYLDPDETADLTVWLLNQGNLPVQNGQAILRTLTNAVTILDSQAQFGTINPNDSVQNTFDHFRVYAQSSCAIGRLVGLQLLVSGEGYQEIVNFAIQIGYVTASAPLGPDHYGYFAYDNTDIDYPEHPEYAWVEIDPHFGGAGIRVQLGNDEIKVVSLPFNFRYYGQNYNRITICSNGYLAMDSTYLADPYNWHIPSAMGPPALIAPFWDDFRPDTLNASGVFYYFDVANHRFIVQWSRIHHIHGFFTPIVAELQTFQAILFDPDYYPTLTGDGEILFQYYEVVNDDSSTGQPPNAHNYATVGIENWEHTCGLEYTYANFYPPAAAPIVNGRAIKFTTDPPDTFIGLTDENFKFQQLRPKIIASPNPFKNKLIIQLLNPQLPISSVKIYDIKGNLVKSFFTATQNSVANHSLVWNGTDRRDKPVTPGVYFIRFGENQEKSMLKIIKLQ